MSIDDAPQWAQKAGFGTRIQQPWFVPSKGEYDKLYGNRDPLSLSDHRSIHNKANASSFSPDSVTAADLTNLRNIEASPDGTWISYAGSHGNWATPHKGRWPSYAPPNQVSAQRPDESWYRRKRVATDGPPLYSWEQFREYLRWWHLPADLYNAHRNGQSTRLNDKVLGLGKVQYPEPDFRGPYTLAPSLCVHLEPEFRALAGGDTSEVVRVHPFPYRLTVEELSCWNRDHRDASQTRLQNTPWDSVLAPFPSEPRPSRNRLQKVPWEASLPKPPRRPSARDKRVPVTPPPDSTEDSDDDDTADEGKKGMRHMLEKKEGTEDEEIGDAEAEQMEDTEDQAMKDVQEPEADKSGKRADISDGETYDTSARSPLDDGKFTAWDGTLYPFMDRIRRHPKSRKLRITGMKWRQQKDRRDGHGTRDAPPAYADDEKTFLQQWLDEFGTTFHTKDILRLFNGYFSIGKGRAERSEQGLAEKLRRMAGSSNEKAPIQKPTQNCPDYVSRVETWETRHCRHSKATSKRKRDASPTRSARERSVAFTRATSQKRQRLATSAGSEREHNGQEENDSREDVSAVTEPFKRKIVISGEKIAASRALVAKQSRK